MPPIQVTYRLFRRNRHLHLHRALQRPSS
ncbi:MAG: hypothetical protein RL240_323, partial [Planctomycetota bacterium]